MEEEATLLEQLEAREAVIVAELNQLKVMVQNYEGALGECRHWLAIVAEKKEDKNVEPITTPPG